jgi:uncharacterized linocin/CFP29 family protein
MTILKRSLAPIAGSAWEEIDDQAKKVLKSYLTARKFVDVEGPKAGIFQPCRQGVLKSHRGKTQRQYSMESEWYSLSSR